MDAVVLAGCTYAQVELLRTDALDFAFGCGVVHGTVVFATPCHRRLAVINHTTLNNINHVPGPST